MILVFTAMTPETDACLGWAPAPRQRRVAGYPVFETGDVAVCQTGLGRRAKDAADAVLAQYSPSAVLSAGTAGGLRPGLPVGSIVLCEHIHHADMRAGHIEPQPARSDPALVAAALEVAARLGLPAGRGSSVTVDEPAWGPAEKCDLHEWMKHDVTEMESYWIGKSAESAGVPYLAVRATSDAAGDELPRYPGLNADGTLDPTVFQAYCRENPHLIPAYAAQGERARIAIGNLTLLMSELLPAIASAVAAP